MNTEPNNDRWYALQLRSRWESSTAALLSCKGYETFLPIYKTLKRGGGKSKELQSPLFPGYLFCRFNVCDRLPVLITPGVISVVGTGRMPIPTMGWSAKFRDSEGNQVGLFQEDRSVTA